MPIPGGLLVVLQAAVGLQRFGGQKTFLGYTYRGGPGAWQWLPPEDREVDLTAFRRVITTARRC